jgi:hypothetical protein
MGLFVHTANSLQFMHTEWRFCVQVEKTAAIRANGGLREPGDPYTRRGKRGNVNVQYLEPRCESNTQHSRYGMVSTCHRVRNSDVPGLSQKDDLLDSLIAAHPFLFARIDPKAGQGTSRERKSVPAT